MHCQTHIQDIIVDCRDQQGDGGGGHGQDQQAGGGGHGQDQQGGGGHGSGEQACKHLLHSSSLTLLLSLQHLCSFPE